MVKRFPFLLVLLLAGCADRPASPARTSAPASAPAVLRGVEIGTDSVWEGRIVIDGTVKVTKGAKLTIRPGTEIAFLRRDDDRDGLGDGTLIVEGALHAEGTRAQPIRFHSAAIDPHPGDWLEIRVDFSPEVRLRFCEITDSAYTLHAHFTRGFMEDCTIRRNIDGSRLGQANFAFRNCLIEDNEGKGLNFRNSQVEIVRNIIRHNGAGIFLFENDRSFTLRDNNIYGNSDNFRLGDFYTGNVHLSGNWWGTNDKRAAEKTLYDRRRDPEIGVVTLEPAPAWIAGTGPRDSLALHEVWRFETAGFVDAGAIVSDGIAYVPSWDGFLYALDSAGKLVWKKNLGDVMDAQPVLGKGAIFLQNWQREVHALDRQNGREIWRFTYAPSAADDHRQGGLQLAGDLLLVPGWNGNLYALDAVNGVHLWQAAAGQPLRAAPAVDGDRIYQGSGAGVLSAWDLKGESLWQVKMGAPLLAAPAITPQGPITANRNGLLIALDRKGRERWRRSLGEACYYAAPLYYDRALYVGTVEGYLWKLDAASGRTIWRFQATGPLYAQPLLADGRLIIGDNSARLLVIGADSGDLLASFRAEGEIQGTPALLGKRIIFGSRDHRVYGLEMEAGEQMDGHSEVKPAQNLLGKSF